MRSSLRILFTYHPLIGGIRRGDFDAEVHRRTCTAIEEADFERFWRSDQSLNDKQSKVKFTVNGRRVLALVFGFVGTVGFLERAFTGCSALLSASLITRAISIGSEARADSDGELSGSRPCAQARVFCSKNRNQSGLSKRAKKTFADFMLSGEVPDEAPIR